MSLFSSILYHCRFLLLIVWRESTSYVFPFRMVFYYLVTTGWIFDISLCENSINQSINVKYRILDSVFLSFGLFFTEGGS